MRIFGREEVESMTIPTLAEAEEMLSEAGDLNPGPWTDHVRFVADGAERIARLHPELDPERSRILALLHDIGRREGRTDMRHVIDGYNYLRHRGLEDAARICLTHSFPVQDVDAASGEWDCSQEELASVRENLNGLEYGDYDRLLQLCDAIALPSGFCLIEKRLVDVALRRGINEMTTVKWKAFLHLERDFSKAIGRSIYSILPHVVENTFGFDR